jgi:hypothetical protein
LLISLLIACSAAPTADAPTVLPSPATTPLPLASAVILGDRRPGALPAVQERQARIAAALQAPPYILRRTDLEPALQAAQDAAVSDPRVQAAARTTDGQPLRTEVMTVAPARAGDLPAALQAPCAADRCTRVVLYVYPTNTTVTALVDAQNQVRDVQSLPGAQPEIPQDLADLAVQIALHDPHLHAAFDGLTPTEAMALMSATKTGLETTTCERSRHLCVAPVFVWGDQALWTIVDLTDFTLVAATTWTEQGASGRRRVASEATLQDAALAPLCEMPQTLARDGWEAEYLLTSSDGLELRTVTFQGQPVLTSAKVVDWHVTYAGTDGQRPGFADAVGCPVFSSAAVIPYGPPTIQSDADGGFTFQITFRSPNWPQPCNYQYTFSATFAPDGSLTVLAGNEGRGCGLGGIYHPILRLEPPAGALSLSTDAAPVVLETEGMDAWTAETPLTFTVAGDEPQRITPLWGEADSAYLYWTRANDAEGRGDLPSIARVGSFDIQQGPDQFVDGEALDTAPVLWFVPRIANAERERCWADSTIQDGELVAEIWPCTAGLRISKETPVHATP